MAASSGAAPLPPKPFRLLKFALLAAAALAAVAAVRALAQALRHPLTAAPPPRLVPRGGDDGSKGVSATLTVLYLNASQTAGPYPPDFSCFTAAGTPLTCSPSWCATAPNVIAGASERSCVAPAMTQNYVSNVASVGCSSCTPSTDARCTAAFLAATFGRFPSVFAAYCNAGYLAVLTSMVGSGAYNLDNIPLPPGGNDGSACRTRSESLTQSWAINTFPLSPVLYPAAALSNNAGFFTDPLYFSPTNTTYWLSASGRVGSSLSGMDIFPVYNNRALFTSENCEVDACNEHVGQGYGQPHLHGDPFGPTCLYSAANYTVDGAVDWTAHPPLIGIADDGLWIYGRYLSSAAPGGSVALDICGGHSHGGSAYGQGTSDGYHYHTQLIAATSSGYGSGTATAGLAYPQTTTGPYKCFRANLSANPQYGVRGPGVGQACCGSSTSQYYVRAGYSLTLTASSGGAIASAAASASTAATASRSATATASATPVPRIVITFVVTVPNAAAATSAATQPVLTSAANSTARALGVNAAWVTASTTTLSRRDRALQASSVTWYVRVVPAADGSAATVAAITSMKAALASMTAANATAALAPTFQLMAADSSSAVSAFAVSAVTFADSTAAAQTPASPASLSGGAIAGIAIGAAVGVALIATAVAFAVLRARAARKKKCCAGEAADVGEKVTGRSQALLLRGRALPAV